MKRLFLILFVSLFAVGEICAQKEAVKNQPYADMKLFHLGFHVGLHTEDLILTNSGKVTPEGETWFAEIPSYSPGFSVGVIGDMFMNPYMNLRFTPTIHFGDRKFTFIEKTTGETFITNVRSSYLNFPLDVKMTAVRLNNYRPYVTAGAYYSFDIGRKMGNPLLLKSADYGVEFGFGCDFYLPYFKLCPEVKFCFGLRDLLEKKRTDLSDATMVKYGDALSKASSRMIVFTFNFE